MDGAADTGGFDDGTVKGCGLDQSAGFTDTDVCSARSPQTSRN